MMILCSPDFGLRVGGWECSLVTIAPTLPPLAIVRAVTIPGIQATPGYHNA